MEDSTPSLTKFSASQLSAHFRPWSKKSQKIPFGIVHAGRRECAHEAVVRDAVDQYMLQPAIDDTLLRHETRRDAMSVPLAHRDILRGRTNLVAIGAKGT
jgi:hypothetical protein